MTVSTLLKQGGFSETIWKGFNFKKFRTLLLLICLPYREKFLTEACVKHHTIYFIPFPHALDVTLLSEIAHLSPEEVSPNSWNQKLSTGWSLQLGKLIVSRSIFIKLDIDILQSPKDAQLLKPKQDTKLLVVVVLFS